MAQSILGLDIGGANLKAATVDKRAVSVPFPLWKQPDKLPSALAELVAKFPDATELAVTMTGELCDCFETKRDGVNAIIAAVRFASAARPIRVWSTDGVFLNSEEAKQNHMKVAASNWHALATFAGRFAPEYGGVLLDVGSTTTDIVPYKQGVPVVRGLTDRDRLLIGELVYVGVGRTPVCALETDYHVCAELFATTQDVFVLLGDMPEDPTDYNTADGRPLTLECSRNRLARMLGADSETLFVNEPNSFAFQVRTRLIARLARTVKRILNNSNPLPQLRTIILSGAGEFLARSVVEKAFGDPPAEHIVSLNEELGPAVSACAPAYAVAVLATERPT